MSDSDHMERALRAASGGLGHTGTNPMVGACLVRDGSVLAEAGHQKLGEAHAERRLMEQAPDDLSGARLYLTLEPCIQYRRTPPCLPLLVDRGLDEVLLASRDPHSSVSGTGIRALRRLDVPVRDGVCEGENRWLNRAYFYRQTTGYPWIDLKLALSADGYLATPTRHSQWITGEESRAAGHRLRNRVDAVMVGAGTLRDDNPRLTDRVTGDDSQPRAVVVARSSRGLSLDQKLFQDRPRETILVIPPTFESTLRSRLSDRGVTILLTDQYGDRFDWRQVLPRLARLNVGRILVEGGAGLAGSLLDRNLVRECHLFYSGKLFGNGLPALRREESPRRVGDADDASLLRVERFEDDAYVHRLVEPPSETLPDRATFDELQFDWLREC
jgi:diaminohydroxyphosphoribosylaminopyrimidine deaminase/5-amino-6-(5-phosphoribosylamino)uracil reductase